MSKKLFISLLTSLTLLTCNVPDKEKTQTSHTCINTVNTLMDQWHKDAANAQLEAYLSLMHESSNYIGTDGTENWSKAEFRAFCEPYFKKQKTWDFKPLERNVYISQSGDIAWFEEILKTGLGPCRGSGVFELYNGQWLLKQYVLSMMVPNDDVKPVLEAKHLNDSIFLNRFSK